METNKSIENVYVEIKTHGTLTKCGKFCMKMKDCTFFAYDKSRLAGGGSSLGSKGKDKPCKAYSNKEYDPQHKEGPRTIIVPNHIHCIRYLGI